MIVAAVCGFACAGVLALRLRASRSSSVRASHELRGPLTAAQLALDGLIRRGSLDAVDALALEAQLRRARLALDDLAVGTVPDRLEPLSAGGLVSEVASAWEPVAAGRGIELRVSGAALPGALLADPVRLSQAVGNLVANALEHGAGPVELRARCTVDRFRLEVRDGGPGLPAPVRALARRPSGLRGHGLSIACSIAERHGGRVVAAPSPSGAAVALELPLYPELEP